MPTCGNPPDGTSPEHWQRIEELYHSALKLPPDERAAFLEKECGHDETLLGEVESLLGYQTAPDNDPINEHAIEMAAQMIAEEAKNSSDDPFIGSTIGNLKFLGKLGAGGMGSSIKP